MNLNIKEKLDEYLEFDSKDIFFDDYIVIYGGAIRDIIANQKINDIDILVKNTELANKLEFKLVENGYHQTLGEKTELYQNLNLNFEPITYINDNNKKIQIIRPNYIKLALDGFNSVLKSSIAKNIYDYAQSFAFYQTLANVDLSCCGLFYDGINVYESIYNSIDDCINKKIIYFNDNLLSNSFNKDNRINKMLKRGWNLSEIMNINQSERSKKLTMVLGNNFNKQMSEYKFKVKYKYSEICQFLKQNHLSGFKSEHKSEYKHDFIWDLI
jgi:predicted nucleotidyltransferase